MTRVPAEAEKNISSAVVGISGINKGGRVIRPLYCCPLFTGMIN